MKNKVTQFFQKPFVRNVAILTSGTAASQFVGTALSPIITRLYGPEAYGLMGTFTAIVSMVGPIAALTYPIAIVLPKHDEEAEKISKLALIISVGISIIMGIILLLFKNVVVKLFQLENINTYLFLIPIVILTAGILQIIEQWLIRNKQFKISASATFLQTLITNGSKVLIGLVYPASSVLIIFSAIAQGLKAFLVMRIAKVPTFQLVKQLINDKSSVKEVAVKYKDFPLYRAPQTIVDSLSQSIPILMLATFFGPASVGFYNIGRTVLTLPTNLIGKSIGDVFYPKISSVANTGGNVGNVLKRATSLLIIIGIIPYGIIIVFGPTLFSFVFGTEWVTAGEYARWLALWSYSTFMLQPTMRTLPVLMAQKFHLVYTVLSLIVRFTMLLLSYYLFSSDVVAIASFSIISGIMNIILMLITMYISKKV